MSLTTSDLQAVRKALHNVRTKWYDIGLALGVSLETLECIKSKNERHQDCLREMLTEWLKMVKVKPSWKVLVEALRDVTVDEDQLAEELERKHCSYQAERSQDNLEEEKDCQSPDTTEYDFKDDISRHTSGQGLMLRLKSILITLKHLRDTPNKFGAIEEAICDFITASFQTGHSLKLVEEQLHSLHKEHHISRDTLTKALEMATKEHERHTPSPRGVSSAESAQLIPTDPLFSKDTLYHAGICSHVVSTCDPGDYQKFFKNKDVVPGHSFKAVSLSRSKRGRFLIAKKGESTYYFAFQSEPQLLEWGKQFNSFSEGIMSQSEQFPVRFIVELLNKQCRIVLTGFSFGGVLACAVAARVWDTPYISSDLLKDNMTCITFGQPHVAVDVINKVVKRRPEIVSTLHAVYLEDDLIPCLMRFLDESWSAQSLSERGESVHVEVPFEIRAPFKDPVTSALLEKLGDIQDMSLVLDEVVAELKSKLKELLSKTSTHQLPLSTTSYQISCGGPTGLVWSKMTAEQVSENTTLKNTLVEQLSVAVYEMNTIKEYTESLFFSHLDKSPKYSVPPSKHAPSEVGDLKPSITEMHIHHHGNETAIVLEGSNLWFSYQISLGGHSLKISAQDISGSSIQFNIPREANRIQTMEGSSKERVSLQSHFSKPIKDDITVYEKGYSITTRQEQLARLTPSQVIELGYLSALLEQHPYSKVQPSSHKLEVIAKFLEEVVRVVPFESIAYAIANTSYDTAVMCYEALMSCGIELPISDVMQKGLLLALQRMSIGYPGQVIQTLNVQARESVPFHCIKTVSVDEEQEEITLSVSPRQLGIPFPLGGPTNFTADVRPFKSVQSPINLGIKRRLHDLSETVSQKLDMKELAGQNIAVISELNIEVLYPVKGLEGKTKLNSPLDILTNGHKQLADLARKAQDQVDNATKSKNYNQEMLKCVNDIRSEELHMCTSLLGGFMDQQEIQVLLSKSSLQGNSESLAVFASASVGVWALFSLDYSKVEPLLTKCRGDKLLVKILGYVKSISGVHTASEDSGPYAAKLQFMVQGMTKTVTCNTQHISYSLERQLVELCRERKISADTSLDDVNKKWSRLFKGNTLSLVDYPCRPLIARWLKWALMIHNLREGLARYTAVGVTGLVNSGKSKLVNTLFGIPLPTGTTEVKRTTVPFLYNLDESVEGLNVVDFPGVDDEDDIIGELADLLLTIAQIILFIVDYRKVHTQSAKKWLERLQKEKVPVLVCLTFGDKLYAEQMSNKGDHPIKEDMKHLVKEQLTVIEGKLRPFYLHKLEFFSFSQDNDSVLNNEEGRKRLRDVGIGSPQQVGEWLVRVFRKDFGQDKVADHLEPFMSKNIEKA